LVSTESAHLRLSKYIERQLPTLNAPGIAIGLTHREQILHVGSYGFSNLEAKLPVTPHTLFQIGSISKSFTSSILLQLQEQGLLDINDPVTKYLPWFEIQSKYDPITLRHLMSHTAGIITGSDSTVSAYTEAWQLRYTKATAPPGEMFHYSNSGYKILGLVLETVLEQDISSILRERILEPLDMTSSLPAIRTSDRQRMAVGYAPYHDDRPLSPGGLLAPATWIESDTADGSICSTAGDMCRYLKVLLNYGNGLLSPDSFKQLIDPMIATGDGMHGERYGLGLTTQEFDGHHVIGHSGGMVGFTADMLADLDSGLGVIVLTNGPAEPSKVSHFALKLFNAALDGNDLPDCSEDQLDNAYDYIGTYRCDEKSFTLKADESRLYLDFESATVPLHSLSTDSFVVPNPAFEMFALRMKCENERVTGAVWGAERYVRDDSEAHVACEYLTEWDAYPGHYRSHNPWLSNFRIVLRQGSLVFIYPLGEEERLQQLEPGLFRIGDDQRSPEFLRFDAVIDGKAMQANFSGGVYSRMFTP